MRAFGVHSEELSRSHQFFAEQPVHVHVCPMQAALSRLPLADLMSLMQYIVTSTQAGYASGAYPAPAHTLQSEGDSTYDGLVSRADPLGSKSCDGQRRSDLLWSC